VNLRPKLKVIDHPPTVPKEIEKNSRYLRSLEGNLDTLLNLLSLYETHNTLLGTLALIATADATPGGSLQIRLTIETESIRLQSTTSKLADVPSMAR
jgi:hypothetical protein